MIVEICANSFQSAQNAELGGAQRIELCEDLSVGGVTPSRMLIEKVISELNIETHVLIRPRSGNFVYSEKELEQMISDIRFCKQIGVKGIVSGVLTDDHKVDIFSTSKLILASKGMQFTFHRAIDECRDLLTELNSLKKMEVDRVLSSGRKLTAIQGIDTLSEMNDVAKDKIEIMPGAGINSENVLHFKKEGFASVHLSAIPKTSVATSLFAQKVEGISNLDEIRKVIQILS